MIMALQMSALPSHATNILLPSPKCLRSRCHFVSCLCRTSFGFKKRLYPCFCFFYQTVPSVCNSRRTLWSIRSMVDGSRSDPPGSTSNSGTRLVRAIQIFLTRINTRFKELRKGLFMKVLFFLVGFYCATAFSTVIGQTGDWDVLSAGLAVVVVEGIGALMYRASFQLIDRIKALITLFNYWKAGLTLGLFLDAFKYEIDIFFEESCDLLNIDIDVFPGFW